MTIKALKPLNYKGKTVETGKIIELDDMTAKKLVEIKAVEEIKEQKAQTKTGNDK